MFVSGDSWKPRYYCNWFCSREGRAMSWRTEWQGGRGNGALCGGRKQLAVKRDLLRTPVVSIQFYKDMKWLMWADSLRDILKGSHLASGISWGKTELADRDSGRLLIDRFRILRNSALNFRLMHLIASSTPPAKLCSSWNVPHHRKYSQHSTGGSGYFFGIFLTPFPVLPFLNASASPAGSALEIYPTSSNYQQLYHH